MVDKVFRISTFLALGASLSIGVGSIAATASAANLVKNGTFDNLGKVWVNNTGNGGDDLQFSGATAVPDWTSVKGFVNDQWTSTENNYGLMASDGSAYFLDLTGQHDQKPYGGIEQKVTTVPGTGYKLTFALGASTYYGSSALTASAKGTAVLASHLFSLKPTATSDWVQETVTFIADSDTTTIEFLADSDNTTDYVGLDNVVMEPRLLKTSTELTVSPTTAASGTSLSLTALVKPSEGTLTPVGKVQFRSGTQVLGSATLNGAGQATFTTTALAVGKDSLTAVYSGDSIHSESTSTTETVTITSGGGSSVTMSTKSLAFGNHATGSRSAAKSVTITNSGTATVTFASIAIEGGQADDFASTKTCGSTLAPKDSCTVSVTFKPVSAGDKFSTIKITDNASRSPQTVAISGVGTAAVSSPALSLNPESLVFGSEKTGSTAAAKTVTLTNSGSAALLIKSIDLTGGQADDYALKKNCGASLAVNAKCSVSVTFKPVSTGVKSASISIVDNASGSPRSVALSGTGT